MKNKIKIFIRLILLSICLSISSQDYDILIQNGHIIDVKNNIDGIYDLAISKNKIVALD